MSTHTPGLPPIAPAGLEPDTPQVGVFGRRITLRVGAGLAFLSPDDSASLRDALIDAEGEARGAGLAQGGAP